MIETGSSQVEPATLRTLLSNANSLTVVCHNNPDPDCLSSAFALTEIAATAGIQTPQVWYDGTISHQQNRAFVNLIDIDPVQYNPTQLQDLSDDCILAFVDHAQPGENNSVPADVTPDIVIDHHSVDDVSAEFVDHRPEIGATATILTHYIHSLKLGLNETLATALLFAIRRETLGFLRGSTPAEYAAAGYLHTHADHEQLRSLSEPPVTAATLDSISTAIDNRTVHGSVLVSYVGRTTERDALPQAADYMLELEGVKTAIVFGLVGDSIHLSARSPDPHLHIGEIMKRIFNDVGNAGGHYDMAGGEIPLGIFADGATDDVELLSIIESVVISRLSSELPLTSDANTS